MGKLRLPAWLNPTTVDTTIMTTTASPLLSTITAPPSAYPPTSEYNEGKGYRRRKKNHEKRDAQGDEGDVDEELYLRKETYTTDKWHADPPHKNLKKTYLYFCYANEYQYFENGTARIKPLNYEGYFTLTSVKPNLRGLEDTFTFSTEASTLGSTIPPLTVVQTSTQPPEIPMTTLRAVESTQPPAMTTLPAVESTQPPAMTTLRAVESTQPPAESTQPPAMTTLRTIEEFTDFPDLPDLPLTLRAIEDSTPLPRAFADSYNCEYMPPPQPLAGTVMFALAMLCLLVLLLLFAMFYLCFKRGRRRNTAVVNPYAQPHTSAYGPHQYVMQRVQVPQHPLFQDRIALNTINMSFPRNEAYQVRHEANVLSPYSGQRIYSHSEVTEATQVVTDKMILTLEEQNRVSEVAKEIEDHNDPRKAVFQSTSSLEKGISKYETGAANCPNPDDSNMIHDPTSSTKVNYCYQDPAYFSIGSETHKPDSKKKRLINK